MSLCGRIGTLKTNAKSEEAAPTRRAPGGSADLEKDTGELIVEHG